MSYDWIQNEPSDPWEEEWLYVDSETGRVISSVTRNKDASLWHLWSSGKSAWQFITKEAAQAAAELPAYPCAPMPPDGPRIAVPYKGD